MTGAFLVGVRASLKKGVVRSAMFDMSAMVCPIEGPIVDESEALCDIGRWLWVEPTNRETLGPTRSALRSNRRTPDSQLGPEFAKRVEEAGNWWRDLMLAVHRVAGEPTCFVYHWYQGQFATEIVRPGSWTVLRPEAVTSEVFHDLDFDDAFVIR